MYYIDIMYIYFIKLYMKYIILFVYYRPKVTFYGHYDVQPALENDWHSDPFHLSVIDGYMYGRGVSDNKGPILAFIYAVKDILKDIRKTKKHSGTLDRLST